jgi:hypothetical protein
VKFLRQKTLEEGKIALVNMAVAIEYRARVAHVQL